MYNSVYNSGVQHSLLKRWRADDDDDDVGRSSSNTPYRVLYDSASRITHGTLHVIITGQDTLRRRRGLDIRKRAAVRPW